MKWVGYIFAVLIGLPIVLFGLSYLDHKLHVYTHAFRLSVEIDTPDGARKSASVISITCNGVPFFPIGMLAFYGSCSIKGDAPFVDLGNGKNAIMLLDFENYLAAKALGRDTVKFYANAPNWVGLKAELKPPLIPTLVTFIDINEPASARVVYATGTRNLAPIPGTGAFKTEPAVLVDRIAETFGPGYAFHSASIEMVPASTPVTRGIEGRLPKWKVQSYYELKNPDGSSLSSEQRQLLININSAFVRKN
jgi:hypothetical protein